MKKIIFLFIFLLNSFLYGASVKWNIEKMPSIRNEIEFLELKVSATIEKDDYTQIRLKANIMPFSDNYILAEGKGRDIFSELVLEVKPEFSLNYSKNKKYYTALIKSGFDTILKKEFTIVLTSEGIELLEGHIFY